ncbi:unnamed protein product [Paramecium octaurelia]|uniref:Uncharacterized protein n=1 Tax=Paramecium octaurelia TaxID=43137 RepID=A0A8S1X7L4_PAROT|nr:unnamed protein product [Paramecium octaurelia]
MTTTIILPCNQKQKNFRNYIKIRFLLELLEQFSQQKVFQLTCKFPEKQNSLTIMLNINVFEISQLLKQFIVQEQRTNLQQQVFEWFRIINWNSNIIFIGKFDYY